MVFCNYFGKSTIPTVTQDDKMRIYILNLLKSVKFENKNELLLIKYKPT